MAQVFRGSVKPAPWRIRPLATAAPELWRGAVFGLPLLRSGYYQDIVQRGQGDAGANVEWGESLYGPYLRTLDAADAQVTYGMTSALAALPEGDHTIWAFVRLIDNGTTTGQFIFAAGDGVHWVRLGWHEGLNQLLGNWDDDVSKVSLYGTPTDIYGRWSTVAMVRRGSTYYLYRDGVEIGATGISTSFTIGGSTVRLGGAAWDTTERTEQNLASVLAFDRALTVGELRHLAADPFAPFRPAERRVAFVAAAGLDNARLADLAFCRGRMRFGPGRMPVPDGTID